MSISFLLLIIAVIGVAGYLVGSWRANALAGGRLSNLHSRPGYYGSFVAIWAMLPALVVLLVWIVASPIYIGSSVRAGFPDEVKAEPQATQNLNYNMIGAIARGLKLLSAE
jgi:phosphate transport system permease protein